MKSVVLNLLSKKIILCTVLLIINLVMVRTQAQNDSCGFAAIMTAALQEDPDYQDFLDSMNQDWVDYLNNGGSSLLQTDYEIPVVVHIMHDNGIENISDQQIIDAIEGANYKFAGGEGGWNTNIKFKLAKIDPNGNCTNGINRVHTTNPDVNKNDLPDIRRLYNLNRWDPFKYLNIYSVRCILPDSDCSAGSATAGFAKLLDLNYELDGVTIAHNYFGNTEVALGNETNTLTHELGHYLNLYHVWGPDWLPNEPNARCMNNCHDPDPSKVDCQKYGDEVCDTNPAYSGHIFSNCDPYYDSCNGCPNNENLPYPKENYMSYNFLCQFRYTEGQAERMYHSFEYSIRKQWEYENRACTGMFAIDENLVTEDETWTTNNLYNEGDITILGDLIVEPGAKLIIDQGVKIRFCGDGRLIIKQNAELELHGILTNSCGAQWKGVEVWGDNSKSQSHPSKINKKDMVGFP